MAEKFKLTSKFTPSSEKKEMFTLSDKFQPSDELLRQQAETAKQRSLQLGLENAVSAVNADLKIGLNGVGKRKMSAGLDYYVGGNPIPAKNPAPGIAAVNKSAEDYAKKVTAGDGFEGLSLNELKAKTEKAKKDYDSGFKGENIIQTGLNLLGGHNAYKYEYEKLRDAYHNRLNAFNEYNRNIAIQKGEEAYDEKEYDIKSKGTLGKTVDVLEHIDNIVSAGGNMFRQSANATMNVTFGNLAKAFGFKNNIFQQGYEEASYFNNKANERMELSAKQLGDKNNISGTIGANIVNMIPDIILAYASGGASGLETAAKANLGLGAKSTSLLTATQRGITEMAKNPMFFTSFAGEVGNDYYEAMANGATESEAMLAALTASTVNAMIEVGGVQELPSKLLENKSLGKKTLDWVLSSLSEGKEEVLQDFISQLSAKAIYDKDKKVFSLSDDEAIINPGRMAKEFSFGAAAGGLMGGGMLTFNSIVNSNTKAEYKKIGEAARALGDVEGLIHYAQRSIDTDIRTLAHHSDSERISDLELGQLYAYACRDIDGAIGSPADLNTAIDNFNEISGSADSKLINGIATSRLIERLTSEGIDSESAAYMTEQSNKNKLDSETDSAYNHNRGEIYGRTESLRDGGGRVWRENNSSENRAGTVQETNVGSFGENPAAYTGKQSISGGSQSVRDNSDRGIRLTVEQTESLKSSAIKNDDGSLKEVFHFTDNMEFKTFAKGDIGFHFGNEQQAIERGNNLKKTGRIIKAYLDIKKPIHISSDIMNWKPMPLSFRLSTDGIITNNEYLTIYELQKESGGEYNSPAAVELRRILSEKGYDGIVYENMFEGDGESYIAFYPEQVIITDDGIQADLNGSASFSPEAGTKSAFTEYSAKKYKPDAIESYIAQMNGREKLSKDQLQIAMIARKLGHSVIFEDTARTRGFQSDGYIEADGTIHIDYDNTKPVQFIFKHELTHYAEGSELYKSFVDTVKASKVYQEWIAGKVGGKDTAAVKSAKYRQSVIDGYAASGIALTPMQAESELIADFVGDTLFTEDGSGLEGILSDMNAKQRKSFVQYIKDFFAYIKNKLSRNQTATSDILRLEKMFNRVLSETEQKNTADEGGVRYKLQEYSQKQKENWAESKSIILYESQAQLEQFIDDALKNTNLDKKIYFGSVPSDLAKRVFDETGINIENYNCTLRAKEIRKILLHSHGDENYESSRGQRAITKEDIISIPTIIQNPDSIMLSDKLYEGKPAILFVKTINGKTTVVAYVSKKHLDLTVQTMYSGKNKGNLATAAGEQAPANTPEAHVGTVSNNSISKNNTSVNTSISENSENTTEKFSIPFNQAELLDKYDRGEISREEYLNQSNENWKEAVNSYGTIETGENPVNDIPVPKATTEKQKTQRFSRTLIESGKLTNRMVEDMGADILLGKFAYNPVSDKSAQSAADKAVQGGFAESAWREAVDASKMITKDKIAIGEKLLMQAIANKDTKRALELSAELSDVLTRNGQNIQAASMFKKMTGAGKLLTVQQYVNTLNKDLEAKYGDKAPTVKINELIAQQIADSKPGEDIHSIYEDALQDVAAQIPATFLDKWNAWRYMSMLVNPTTHIRNIVGNGLFIPSVRIKDFISASLEAAIVKDQDKRTKSVLIQKEYKEFAEKDSAKAEVKNALKSGGKFNIETEISEKQKIFENNALEFVRVTNGNLLEAEDMISKNIHYRHALAGFLQARGVDLNNMDEGLLWEARNYAVQEALKATFNDTNTISTALSSAANKNKALNIAVNGILPFKKTPVNIVRRGVEYSPVGLLKTLVKGSYDLRQGKITVSEYIDGLGAGISGTVVFAFGALLSSLGYVTGGFGDDEEDKFKKLNGEQEYALQLFGKSYTIDWAAPACIPFFIGVETVKALRENNENFKLSDITEAMWNSLEPVINLSMLSGVQSMIESVKYAAKNKSVIALAGNVTKSYFSQGLPTVFGKTARMFDSKRRSNYIDKNSQLSEFSQSTINTVKSKIPYLESKRPEYVNAWGQTESNGTLAGRLFGNFVSPGYYSRIEYDEVSRELLRISREQKGDDVNVFPKAAQKSFEVNGETKYLTAKEYTEYAKAKGQYSYDYVSEFISSSEYKRLTDAERARVINSLYKYANAKAKTEVSDYDITKSFKAVSQWEKSGKSPVVYYLGRVLAEK